MGYLHLAAAQEEEMRHEDVDPLHEVIVIFWSLIVLAWLLCVVLPFRLVRWLWRRSRRTTPRKGARHAQEQKPDVWRYGYH